MRRGGAPAAPRSRHLHTRPQRTRKHGQSVPRKGWYSAEYITGLCWEWTYFSISHNSPHFRFRGRYTVDDPQTSPSQVPTSTVLSSSSQLSVSYKFILFYFFGQQMMVEVTKKSKHYFLSGRNFVCYRLLSRLVLIVHWLFRKFKRWLNEALCMCVRVCMMLI